VRCSSRRWRPSRPSSRRRSRGGGCGGTRAAVRQAVASSRVWRAEIYLCNACSDHEIEGSATRAVIGGSG
jgi:hypothetical protein